MCRLFTKRCSLFIVLSGRDLEEGKISETQLISDSIFSLDDIPGHARFEVWRESINCVFDVEMDRERRQSGDFHARLKANLFGSIMMVETTSVAQHWARTTRHIARDGMDHFMLQLFSEGTMREDNEGAHVRDVTTRDRLVVFDLSRPMQSFTSDFTNLSLIIPRHAIEDRLTSPDDQHMRVIDVTPGASALLRDLFLSLRTNLASIPAPELQRLQDLLFDLVVGCLNSDQGEDAGFIRRSTSTTIALAKKYIQQNLHDPNLSASSLAERLSISRSRLYGLFDNTDGVAALIRRQRLRQAMRLLSDPNERHRSLYDIGHACGYSSDSTFIRAFRNELGMSPGAFRAEAGRASFLPMPGDQSGPDRRYEHWLHFLS